MKSLRHIVTVCLSLLFTAPVYALNIGDPFPDFTAANTLSPEHSAYLKVPSGGQIQLSKIPHEIIILEFLNVYCHTCRVQVSIFNELKQAIARDADLRDKVCLLGLAVGNSVEEIETFTADYSVQYPILSDLDKDVFNSTGNIRGTPHTYVIRKGDAGFIVDYHAGGVSSAERYLDSIRHTLRSSLIGTAAGNILVPLTFTAADATVTTASLAGQRYVLYFASSKMRVMQHDLRTSALQLNVLKQLARDVGVPVFVFPPDDSTCAGLNIASPMVCALDTGSIVRAQFAPDNEPLVLCVNEHGRIMYREESLPQQTAERIFSGVEYTPVPRLSASEIQERIRTSIAAAGYQIAEIEHLALESRQGLYVITVAPQGSGVFFFARLESGITMCDVCHDTHFVYVFDQNGVVVDFIPLELTKYGNIDWDEADVEKMKKKLVGRSLFEPFVFNPAVDAVTTATMSSSMIYEAMNSAREYFGDFYEYSFREGYWKNACFEVICKVKDAVKIAKKNTAFVFDDTALQKIISDKGLKGCPLGGMYIALDEDILCSHHGLNLKGCDH